MHLLPTARSRRRRAEHPRAFNQTETASTDLGFFFSVREVEILYILK